MCVDVHSLGESGDYCIEDENGVSTIQLWQYLVYQDFS